MMRAAKARRIATSRLGPFVARRRARRVDLPLSTWDLSIGSTGTLWSGDVDLAALARSEGTPLHVARADLLDRNALAALAPASAPHTRGADIFYSYKTNPVPGVLRRLHASGVGAEVISPFELWLASRLGVPPERVIYNGPAKSTDSVRDAIRRDLYLVNANSATEVALIGRLAADERRTVNLGIRVALPDMWGGQFGIASGSPHLVSAVRQALNEPFVDLRGLHFHRGLTIRHRETMDAYVQGVVTLCDSLRTATGWHPAVLDIGGSLASPTVAPIPPWEFRLNRALGTDLLPPDPADCVSVAEASKLATAAIRSHFDAGGLSAPAVILEPGRALTGDAQFLLTSVVDVKDDGGLSHAVLDAGINVAEPVRGEYHQVFSVSAPAAHRETAYRLVGPICTPADVLYNNWRLPRLEPGHVLAVMDSGAYFVPFSTSFSFPKPAIVLQDGARITTLRRRETYADIVAVDGLNATDEPRRARRSSP
jgi:diaminopimelate decarboxylase